MRDFGEYYIIKRSKPCAYSGKSRMSNSFSEYNELTIRKVYKLLKPNERLVKKIIPNS